MNDSISNLVSHEPAYVPDDLDARARDAKVVVVAIGRNEGERLRRCLDSAGKSGALIVYVDSGSTDGSIDLARSFNAVVWELKNIPFTAALARNTGALGILSKFPSIEFIQFVDGDCEIDSNWIGTATAFLNQHPLIAVVCGRRRERFPDATIYNRLCDMEWNTPVGQAKSCGGDALIRSRVFSRVGGFNPSVIAGEEPEMCVRIRQAGFDIWRLDAEMTLHDAAMTRFGQWWKRNVRAGHAYAENYHRHGAPPELMAKKNVISNFVWAALFPLLPLLWIKVKAQGKSALYATFITLSKVPQAIGQLKFHFNRLTGRQQRIIEYK